MYKAGQGVRPYFSDQTRRFPIVSSRGDRLVMVLYDYDSNIILTNPLKKTKKGVGEVLDQAYLIPPRLRPETHGPLH